MFNVGFDLMVRLYAGLLDDLNHDACLFASGVLHLRFTMCSSVFCIVRRVLIHMDVECAVYVCSVVDDCISFSLSMYILYIYIYICICV